MQVEPTIVPGQRPRECGGKGPNKHIVENYGAGPNMMAWVSGEYAYSLTELSDLNLKMYKYSQNFRINWNFAEWHHSTS